MADFDGARTSLYAIKGILILDNDGNRILARYFDTATWATTREQRTFEKSLFAKTSRNTSPEIILLDGVTVLYRSNVDLYFYVLGSSRENELLLESVLHVLYDSLSIVLRKQVEKKQVLDTMDTALLIVDEIVDNGIIMETDAQAVVARCAQRSDEISLTDQTFSQAGKSLFGAAKEQIKWSLMK